MSRRIARSLPVSTVHSCRRRKLVGESIRADAKLRQAILSEFPPAAWEGIGEIGSSHNAEDWAAVGAAGYKLKSSTRTVGANQLADTCEALEEAGKAGDEKTIKKLMPKLRPAMEAVEAFIRGR